MKPMLIQRVAGGIYSLLFLASFAAPFDSSCRNSRNMVCFNGYSDKITRISYAATESSIRANDRISITVSSLNPEAIPILSTTNSTSISSAAIYGNSTKPFGYFVNADSMIQLPRAGNTYATGFTKLALSAQEALGDHIQMEV